MFFIRNGFEIIALVCLSLLLIESYYPTVGVFQVLTTTVLLVVLVLSFIFGMLTKPKSSTKNERKAPYISIYLFSLLLLLNLLPKTNPDAVFSLDNGTFWFAIIIVAFELFFYKKRKQST
ncbi:hypothetical protein [Pontibacillus sp. HMF3514]|uniref:hypothetical protein n=1 Tax=Pontibacillus sp. HMF3514 TaxID=2692425 RepID=UPI00131F77BF|nr:hypothetical protein [Pontibacillus sp. HMF3514]QHE54047.1 hypothetical protein GS400_19355 [Pontibacillus sp. HMF3514]